MDDIKIQSLLLVEFTEKNDGFFNGKAIDYNNYNVILFFNAATKRKKAISWKKIVYLNKPMITMVESISEDTIVVSLAYLADMFPNNTSTDEMQKILLHNYTSNKKLKQMIKQFDEDNWELHYNNIVNNANNNLNYLEYLENNIQKLSDDNSFITYYKYNNKDKPKKIVSEVKIISNKGVQAIKELFLQFSDIKVTIKSPPIYIVETHLYNQEEHDKIINKILIESAILS